VRQRAEGISGLVSVWNGLTAVSDHFGRVALRFAVHQLICATSNEGQAAQVGTEWTAIPPLELPLTLFDGARMESDELNLLEQIGKCEERCVFWEKKIKAHKESLKNFNQRNLELGRQHAHIDQQVKECQQLQQQVAELEKRVLATQTGTNERRLNGPEPEQLSIFRRRWQSEPEAVRRSLDIYGTLRDLARVANSRLANMLSAHLGGNNFLQILLFSALPDTN